MNKIVQIVLMLFVLISCNNKENQSVGNRKFKESIPKQNNQIKTSKNQPNQLLAKKTQNTLIFKYQVVVIFGPTDESIEKRRREIGDEDFYVGADDYMWYLNESNEYLKKQKAKVKQVQNNQTLKFVQENGDLTIVTLSKERELWGIYLFDPKIKPKKIDITDTAQEYKEYFGV